MTTIGKRRMGRMITFLEKLPTKRFDLCQVRVEKKCGTVACVVGWAPTVFPTLFKKQGWDLEEQDYADIGAQIFQIPESDADDLFTPNREIADMFLSNKATPKQVARRMRKYMALCAS